MPHVEINITLVPTGDPNQGIVPGIGIKIKDNGGIRGNVGCSIIGYFDANFWSFAHAYIEAGGDGTLFFKTPSDQNNFFYDFELKAWFYAQLNVLTWTKECYWNYSWRWSDQKLILDKETTYNETQWKSIDRSYLHPDDNEYNYFTWQQYNTSGTLIQNVFPYSQPCITSVPATYNKYGQLSNDNEVMIVWAHDNKVQPLVKSMELRYTRASSDGFVDPPQTIPATYNDSRLQMDPQIIYDTKGNIICVFVQTNSSISQNSSATDMMKATEIAYCIWYNTNGTWSPIYSLTNNTRMDVQPRLSSNSNGYVVCIWTSDSDNNYETLGDDSIYASFWNGTNWSPILTVAKNFEIVSTQNVAINDNDEAICVFSRDTDGNPLTTGDHEIYYIKFHENGDIGAIQQFTSDYDNQDTNPSVVYSSDGKPYIIWLKKTYRLNQGVRIDDATIYYQAVSTTLAERIQIINGTVHGPFTFQSHSSMKSMGRDNNVEFAVLWKDGASSSNLSMAKIRTTTALSKDGDTEISTVYSSSDKNISDVYSCFTQNGIALVTTKRDTLQNGGKNCDLYFLFNTSGNTEPYEPSNPTPSNEETNVEINTTLSWIGGDPDSGDTISYDIYFGQSNTPTKCVANQTQTTYIPDLLNYNTTYYWKVISWDNHRTSTSGPLWHFTTRKPLNHPPNKPRNPSPTNGATTVDINPTLNVFVTDSDGDSMIVRFYNGANNNLIGTTNMVPNGTTASVTWSGLNFDTNYQWYAVANDSSLQNKSDTWSFTTKSSGGGNNGGNGGGEEPSNIPPVADTSAEEPYRGVVGENINFDGSKSHDTDGTIVKWYWTFGDGTNGSGKIVTHAYTHAGTFPVKLTVTDNQGATNTKLTTTIITSLNEPPTKPTLFGPTTGTVNTSYTYTALSADTEDSNLTYAFDWGDTTSSSITIPNGTNAVVNHTWTSPGIYRITVVVKDDQNALSTPTSLIMFIGVEYVGDIGHLIDRNGDGTYDSFYCNETGNKTTVELKDGQYLIDTNGDGKWEYTFDPLAGVAAIQNEVKKVTPGFEIILIICAVSLILLCRRYRKNSNK